MKNIYKLMVVEDEFNIRNGLMSIDWSIWGFEAVASASNGNEALEIAARIKPDVILTDIKMPVMDGLELSQKVREEYPRCKVVILTVYEDFAYAKAAINAGVCEYIVKPIVIKQIEEVFLKLKKQFDLQRSEESKISLYEKQLAKSLPVAIEKFLNEIIDEKVDDINEIEEIQSLLEIRLNYSFYACIIISHLEDEQDREADNTDFEFSYIKEYIESVKKGYVIQKDNQIAVIAAFDLDSDEKRTSQTYIEDMVYSIQNEFHSIGHKNIRIGAGNIYNNILYLSASYQQAEVVLKRTFFENERRIFFSWKEKSINYMSILTYPYNKEGELINALIEGDSNKCQRLVTEFWDELRTAYSHIEPVRIQNIAIQLLSAFSHKLRQYDLELNDIVQKKYSFTELVRKQNNILSLQELVQDIVLQIVEYIILFNEKYTTSCHKAIKKAKVFIEENYNQKLTLNQVANHVFLNKSYFSMQFKKETGKTFLEYLSECRINKAKELLKDTDMKVYEISEKVGYINPKYLTDLFKEYVGCSPQEYRKKLIS